MTALNFQGQGVEIVIFKAGEKVTAETYPAFFRSIASVRAEVKGGETSNVTIQLTPSLVDALAILGSGIIGSGIGPDVKLPDDKLASIISGPSVTSEENSASKGQSNFSYYAVRFFYANGDSTPYYGGFNCQPHFTLGKEIDITIKITGQHNLMAITGGPNRFENESALDVLKKIAAPYGIEITFDDEDDSTEETLSSTKISGSYNEDGESVIRRILTDLRCTYAKYDGDESSPKPQYRIKSTEYLSNQKPVYTFVMYRQVAPEMGVIPIEELSLESNGNLLAPGNVFGTFTRGVSSRTKEVKTKASSPSDFKRTGNSGTKSDSGAVPTDTGDGSAFGGATGLVDVSADVAGNHGPGLDRSDASTMERAQAHSEMASMNMLVFHVKTPGLPLLRPQSKAILQIGDGKDGLEAFCGDVYVQEVVHDWGSMGWVTESKLRKSAGPIFNPAASESASVPPEAPSNKVSVKAKAVG